MYILIKTMPPIIPLCMTLFLDNTHHRNTPLHVPWSKCSAAGFETLNARQQHQRHPIGSKPKPVESSDRRILICGTKR